MGVQASARLPTAAPSSGSHSARLLGRPISLDLVGQPHTVFVHALICLSSTVLSAETLDDVITVELVVAKHDSRWALLPDNACALGIDVPSG